MKVDALILAGSSGSNELTESEGVDNKAFIRIGNRTLLEIILRVICSSDYIERVGVIGPISEIDHFTEEGKIVTVPQRDSILNNVMAGFQHLKTKGHLLIVTADIPLLTKEAVENFLRECGSLDCDLYYPIITKELCGDKYSDLQRTYVRLKEGVFTGGNLFLVNSKKLEEGIPRFEGFIKYRKNPLKLGQLLGLSLIYKYVTGTMKISDVEKCFLKLLHVKGRAIISRFPEIGVDVDKKSDLELVRKVLALSEE